MNVEDEALDDLRRAVTQRYGKLRGHLNEEASAAMRDKAKELRRRGA